MSQNIGCLPTNPPHYKSKEIINQVCTSDTDAWLIQEVGLCWTKMEDSAQWSERTQRTGNRLHSNFAYNKTELRRSKVMQAGGVAVITTSVLIPRCTARGYDPLGLGRWAWTRLAGVNGFHTRLVSVYRPCKPSSQGTGTVYEQHRRRFGANDRDPRQALLTDLRILHLGTPAG